MRKGIHHFKNYERALQRLGEAVDDAESELEIDGVIQRFEFTFELFWKVLKTHLEREGILCQSPRACLKEAFRLNLVDDEEIALRMLEDRNDTMHLYDEEASRAVYNRIKSLYLVLFTDAYKRLT